MNRKLFTLAISCIIVATSAAAYSQEHTQPPRAQKPITLAIPGPSVLGTMRQVTAASYPILEVRLQLTDEQKPKVRELLVKAEEVALRYVEAQRKADKAFADALVSGSSEATLISLGQAALKADSDYLTQRTKTFAALRAMLTESQRKELSAIMERATAQWRGPAPQPQTVGEEPKPIPMGTAVGQ